MEAFLVSTGIVLLVEIGDMSWPATVALDTQYQRLIFIVLCAPLGMVIANLPLVLLGDQIAYTIPIRLAQIIAASYSQRYLAVTASLAYDEFIPITWNTLNMYKLIALSILVSVFVGCTTIGNREEGSHGRLVLYDCINGESLSVRYLSNMQTADLLHRGLSIEMKQQPSGSGFVYSSGPNTIRGKGDDLVVEIGRMAPLRCQAR